MKMTLFSVWLNQAVKQQMKRSKKIVFVTYSEHLTAVTTVKQLLV